MLIWWRLRSLMVWFWLGWLAGSGALATPSVVIVSSQSSAAYMETAHALIGELERGGLSRYEVLQVDSSEWSELPVQSPKLFIALGTDAAERLARAGLSTPVLCTLLPRDSFERVLLRYGRKPSAQFSAIYLDQPISRQIELIRIAMPSVRRVGVLWGAGAAQAPAWRAQAQAKGLHLVEAEVSGDDTLFAALRTVLEGTDLLLAVPNPQVYGSHSIQNILLTSFRAKVPMLGFSPAYVRAGAMLALYVAPSQLAMQAARMARAVLQGKALPESAVYSSEFQVSVNEHVARSLGFQLDERDLNRQLRAREVVP